MFQIDGGANLWALLLIVGLVMLYTATRLIISLWVPEDGSARRRAFAQWVPVGTASAAALAFRQPIVAVCLIFGTSVACLSLVVGLGTYLSPLRQLPTDKRVWPLVLPAALLVLLIGFRGEFTWLHAIMLLVMGSGILAVWREHPAAEASGNGIQTAQTRSRSSGALIVACIVAVLGSLAAVKGAVAWGERSRVISATLLASAVMSPMMMLPAVSSVATLEDRGEIGDIITALCGTVQLNLCLLLPLVILINSAGSWGIHVDGPTAAATVASLPHATPFPLVTWRIDSVVLVLLAFALLPVAAGRWLPERFESILLIAVYGAYVLALGWIYATRVTT